MRWIKERAEALLQLRCIDANDDWEAFVNLVHDNTRAAHHPAPACASNAVSQARHPA